MKILSVFSILLTSLSAHAEFQISNPNDMVKCMQQYVRNWGAGSEVLSGWEQEPSYEFNGKYFFASWHTKPSMAYKTLQRVSSASDNFICDYSADASGFPLRDQGFCSAKVSNGEIKFDLSTTFGGSEKITQKTLAIVSGSKLFCLDIPRQ